MELHMNPAGQWQTDLPKHMFSDDALWFIVHVQWMYMAICTPSTSHDEFILTDNSYNVFEGPNSFVTDKVTGKVEPQAHTPLHEFAPISPKLMIVLRSLTVPVLEEDEDPRTKEVREAMRTMALGPEYKWDEHSLLSDLPITKARNNYSKIIDGRAVLLKNEDGKLKKDHKFCFKYFPVTTKHVHIINSIFLQNAERCSRIVFGAKDSLAQTIEAHVTSQWNVMTHGAADPRLIFLKKLAAVSKSLGSQKEPVWRESHPPEVEDYEFSRIKHIEWRRRMMKDCKHDPNNEIMRIYKSLGISITRPPRSVLNADVSNRRICRDNY